MDDPAHEPLKREQRTREIHWLGPPSRLEEGKVHYRGAEVEGLQLSLGKSDARFDARCNSVVYNENNIKARGRARVRGTPINYVFGLNFLLDIPIVVY